MIIMRTVHGTWAEAMHYAWFSAYYSRRKHKVQRVQLSGNPNSFRWTAQPILKKSLPPL